MTLAVEVQQVSKSANLPAEDDLIGWAQLACLGDDEQTVVIRLVDADESRQLNHAYRQKDYATNVLSFPFEAPAFINDPHLGDLVICAAVVEQEAQQQDKPLMHHWAHMVIHGMLHLQGYDHIEAQQAEQMEALEIGLLSKLNINNPYEA